MRFAAVLCAASLLVLPSALIAEPDANAPLRKVTVIGTAIIKVVPDQMEWSVVVTANDGTLAKAKARHDASLAEALKFLKELGGAITDLQTGGIQFAKRTYFDKDNPAKPFDCTTQITFTLVDFNQYGPIADALSKIDGAEVQGVDYTYSKEAETRHAALQRALQDAHEKANDLAVTAGCYIDRPLLIEEVEGGFVRPEMFNARMVAAPGGTPQAVAGQIEITARLNVTYDLFYK